MSSCWPEFIGRYQYVSKLQFNLYLIVHTKFLILDRTASIYLFNIWLRRKEPGRQKSSIAHPSLKIRLHHKMNLWAEALVLQRSELRDEVIQILKIPLQPFSNQPDSEYPSKPYLFFCTDPSVNTTPSSFLLLCYQQWYFWWPQFRCLSIQYSSRKRQ